MMPLVLRKIFLVVGALALLLAAGGWTAVWLSTPDLKQAPAVFTVSAGDSAATVAAGLARTGYIRSAALFRLALRQSGAADKLQPGTYDLRGAESFPELVKILTSGGVPANEFVLTVIEGWDLRDLHQALKKVQYAQWDSLYAVTGQPLTGYASAEPDFADGFPFLKDKPPGASLEGYLFPDTYRLFRDAAPEEIVRILLANFSRRLTAAGLDAKIAASGHGFHDIITLASVIEKEVRTDADRRIVSDIFWRRLEMGMALQSCATVNYVTGKSSPAVSAEDLRVESPYNTYMWRGLPPGPIGNPGLESIRAALEPQTNDFLYFLTDDRGGVHYASTLEEHNRNKAKYLH